jgi:hypothetical protein
MDITDEQQDKGRCEGSRAESIPASSGAPARSTKPEKTPAPARSSRRRNTALSQQRPIAATTPAKRRRPSNEDSTVSRRNEEFNPYEEARERLQKRHRSFQYLAIAVKLAADDSDDLSQEWGDGQGIRLQVEKTLEQSGYTELASKFREHMNKICGLMEIVHSSTEWADAKMLEV